MRINNNLMALNAARMLSINESNASKSMEKLSSGYRINKAGDDAAGLAISEKMRAQIRGLKQAAKNAQDGISLLQTAEGGLAETHSILQRMRELAVQGANDTLQPEDRTAIQTEINELSAELTRIAETTTFNGANLLDGTFGVSIDPTSTLKVGTAGVTAIKLSGAKASTTYTITQSAAGTVVLNDGSGNQQTISGLGSTTFSGTLNFDKLGIMITVDGLDVSGTTNPLNGLTVVTTANNARSFQIGANEGEFLAVSINAMDAATLGVDTANISVASYDAAKATVTKIETAISTVSAERSRLGAWQNRLEHTINNLNTSAENLQAAESRIRDVDMATEMVEYTKNEILQQAAQAMLAKANLAPQNILQLLR